MPVVATSAKATGVPREMAREATPPEALMAKAKLRAKAKPPTAVKSATIGTMERAPVIVAECTCVFSVWARTLSRSVRAEAVVLVARAKDGAEKARRDLPLRLQKASADPLGMSPGSGQLLRRMKSPSAKPSPMGLIAGRPAGQPILRPAKHYLI